YNLIKSFEGFPDLPNLQILNLNGNQIGSFKGLPALSNLQILTLKENLRDLAQALTQSYPRSLRIDFFY
ncbi:MAG: leucine-rich repeat domain-containing protein, partial [Holosporales bacterium]|nr:leucine-rich repeat domain-containing protein [Holosporales bacterium]